MAKKQSPKKPVNADVPKAEKPEVPYNAAGLSRKGVLDIVTGAEYKRMGCPDYPWPTSVKSDMVEACNGLKTGAEIVAKIKELAPKVLT